jgi:hypothetical protein
MEFGWKTHHSIPITLENGRVLNFSKSFFDRERVLALANFSSLLPRAVPFSSRGKATSGATRNQENPGGVRFPDVQL